MSSGSTAATGFRLTRKFGYGPFGPSTSPVNLIETISPGWTRPSVSVTTNPPVSSSHSSTSPSIRRLLRTTPPTSTDQRMPSLSTPFRNSAGPNLVVPVDHSLASIVSGFGPDSRKRQGLPRSTSASAAAKRSSLDSVTVTLQLLSFEVNGGARATSGLRAFQGSSGAS